MESDVERNKTKFFVRILPTTSFCHENVIISPDFRHLDVRCNQKGFKDRGDAKPTDFWRFHSDGIIYNWSQEDIYGHLMKGVADKAIEGQNSVILSYGQTGSGKSLTLNGLRNTYEDRGVIPRFITELDDIGRRENGQLEVCIKMSYVDFLPGKVVDLLSEECNGKVSVVEIDAENVAGTLFKAESRRKCNNAPYRGVNIGSSVLTLYVYSRKTLVSMAPIQSSVVLFIDLAGIDTIGTESSKWKSIRSIGHANTTKIFLEKFFATLNSKKKFITNDKVLNYIKDSFTSSNSVHVTLIGHVKASQSDLNLTLSVLKLGSDISGKKIDKIGTNCDKVESVEAKKKYELEVLYQKLELNAMLNSQPDFNRISELCKTRYDVISKVADEFVRGGRKEIQLTSVAQVEIVLKQLRDEYEKITKEREIKVNEMLELTKRLEERDDGSSKADSAINVGRKKGSSRKSDLSRSSKKSSKDSEVGDSKVKSKLLVAMNSSRAQVNRDSKISLDKSSKISLPKSSKLLLAKSSRMSTGKGSKMSLSRSSKMSVSRSSKQKESIATIEESEKILPSREIDRHGITIGPGIVTDYQERTTLLKKHDRLQQANLQATVKVTDFEDEISLNSDDGMCKAFYNQTTQNFLATPELSPIHKPASNTFTVSWEEVLESGILEKLCGYLESANSQALDAYKLYVQTSQNLKMKKKEVEVVRKELMEMQYLLKLNGDELVLTMSIRSLLRDLDSKRKDLIALQDTCDKQRTLVNFWMKEVTILTDELNKLKLSHRISDVSLPVYPSEVPHAHVKIETCDDNFRKDAVFSGSLEVLLKRNLQY